jgi:hypothetical protein
VLAVAIVVGSVVVVGAMFLWYLHAARQRRDALMQLASALQLTFEERRPDLALASLGACSLFCLGHSRRMFNVLSGTIDGLDVAVFDYAYTIGTGKYRHTFVQTVAWTKLAEPRFPTFALAPEGVLDKVSELLGGQDIDFPSHTSFSARFRLRGESEVSIRRLFTSAVLDAFERSDDVNVEASGDKLVVYRSGRIAEPPQVRDLVAHLGAVRDMFVHSGGR